MHSSGPRDGLDEGEGPLIFFSFVRCRSFEDGRCRENTENMSLCWIRICRAYPLDGHSKETSP